MPRSRIELSRRPPARRRAAELLDLRRASAALICRRRQAAGRIERRPRAGQRPPRQFQVTPGYDYRPGWRPSRLATIGMLLGYGRCLSLARRCYLAGPYCLAFFIDHRHEPQFRLAFISPAAWRECFLDDCRLPPALAASSHGEAVGLRRVTRRSARFSAELPVAGMFRSRRLAVRYGRFHYYFATMRFALRVRRTHASRSASRPGSGAPARRALPRGDFDAISSSLAFGDIFFGALRRCSI